MVGAEPRVDASLALLEALIADYPIPETADGTDDVHGAVPACSYLMLVDLHHHIKQFMHEVKVLLASNAVQICMEKMWDTLTCRIYCYSPG